jgi:hypothetical protein
MKNESEKTHDNDEASRLNDWINTRLRIAATPIAQVTLELLLLHCDDNMLKFLQAVQEPHLRSSAALCQLAAIVGRVAYTETENPGKRIPLAAVMSYCSGPVDDPCWEVYATRAGLFVLFAKKIFEVFEEDGVHYCTLRRGYELTAGPIYELERAKDLEASLPLIMSESAHGITESLITVTREKLAEGDKTVCEFAKAIEQLD